MDPGGGGTDHPSYFREYEGFLISAAIHKCVYVTLHQSFGDDLLVKYSKVERVSALEDIEHPRPWGEQPRVQPGTHAKRTEAPRAELMPGTCRKMR